MSQFKPVLYGDLNSRQKENYNFHKIAARMADYGFNCLRLTDDWQGADFIACHINGETFLKVQLKGRMTIDKKYLGKDIHIAFLNGEECIVYPHDEMLERILKLDKICRSASWLNGGAYSWPQPPVWAQDILNDYKV